MADIKAELKFGRYVYFCESAKIMLREKNGGTENKVKQSKGEEKLIVGEIKNEVKSCFSGFFCTVFYTFKLFICQVEMVASEGKSSICQDDYSWNCKKHRYSP